MYEALVKLCNNLGIGFIIGGKMYPDIKQYVAETPDKEFFEYKIRKRIWYFLDFKNSRKSWDTSWRCIYTKPVSDEAGQVLLDFELPESILYTNLGMDNEVSLKLMEINNISSIEPEVDILAYHGRARDELVNRAFKDFGTEHIPFKRFTSNAAFYYLMAISFLFLYHNSWIMRQI